jgi:hypothetical protein
MNTAFSSSACGAVVIAFPPERNRYPMDRVEAALRRRLDAAVEARREAAIAPDGNAAFADWNRAVNRIHRLKLALISHLHSKSRSLKPA